MRYLMCVCVSIYIFSLAGIIGVYDAIDRYTHMCGSFHFKFSCRVCVISTPMFFPISFSCTFLLTNDLKASVSSLSFSHF